MPAAVIGPRPSPGAHGPYPPARSRVRVARSGSRRRLRQLGRAAGLAAAAIVLLRPRRVAVHGASMLPALRPGDHLLVVRVLRPRVGQLVVVRTPPSAGGHGTPEAVKRLAAVQPEGLVVLGDNPPASTDSRSWGPLPRRALRGRVVYRYAPRDRVGRVPAACAGKPFSRRP